FPQCCSVGLSLPAVCSVEAEADSLVWAQDSSSHTNTHTQSVCYRLSRFFSTSNLELACVDVLRGSYLYCISMQVFRGMLYFLLVCASMYACPGVLCVLCPCRV
ncbi:hypothetical protein AMECASPLE_019775, partial [Ameca splendens]